jgi:uracil-DNA glycosylase family 4
MAGKGSVSPGAHEHPQRYPPAHCEQLARHPQRGEQFFAAPMAEAGAVGREPLSAAAFASLVERVQACRACPRMEGRRRVLGEANGPLRARAVLVGTAPGRHGAERTGIPFTGDRSGAALDVLLARAGLRRTDVFITNAVLCNPQDAQGRNAQPSAAELQRCRAHLDATLRLVDAPLVVALGRLAYTALRALDAECVAWEDARGILQPWRDGVMLGATYHPGPQVWNQPARRESLLAQWDGVLPITRRP